MVLRSQSNKSKRSQIISKAKADIDIHYRPYIQPAIPLVGTTPQQPKPRAVTDPVAPKPLFLGRNPSVNQLRKAFAHSRQGSRADKQTSPPLPYLTGKAAEILGLTEDERPKRNTTPRSEPVSVKDDRAMEKANERFPARTTSAMQPMPTTQHHRNDSQATVTAITDNLNAKDQRSSKAGK